MIGSGGWGGVDMVRIVSAYAFKLPFQENLVTFKSKFKLIRL